MKNFKRGRSAKVVENIKKQKKIDLKKKATVELKKPVEEESDSEVSDSSDDDYEEVLISNFQKMKVDRDRVRTPSEASGTSASEPESAAVAKILPDVVKKPKSKKIVIKKYYQQRAKPTPTPKIETPKIETPKIETPKIRLNYLGIPTQNNKFDSQKQMSSRIFNW